MWAELKKGAFFLPAGALGRPDLGLLPGGSMGISGKRGPQCADLWPPAAAPPPPLAQAPGSAPQHRLCVSISSRVSQNRLQEEDSRCWWPRRSRSPKCFRGPVTIPSTHTVQPRLTACLSQAGVTMAVFGASPGFERRQSETPQNVAAVICLSPQPHGTVQALSCDWLVLNCVDTRLPSWV